MELLDLDYEYMLLELEELQLKELSHVPNEAQINVSLLLRHSSHIICVNISMHEL